MRNHEDDANWFSWGQGIWGTGLSRKPHNLSQPSPTFYLSFKLIYHLNWVIYRNLWVLLTILCYNNGTCNFLDFAHLNIKTAFFSFCWPQYKDNIVETNNLNHQQLFRRHKSANLITFDAVWVLYWKFMFWKSPKKVPTNWAKSWKKRKK